MNLYDTLGWEGNVQSVIYDLFHSLLLCRDVREGDIPEILHLTAAFYDKLPVENHDSCLVRVQKNYEEIKSVLYPYENYFNFNTIWDEENNRIYQITNLRDMWERKKCVLKLKTYRQGCIYHPISM